ncbi:MAG TPA: hypothetical protein VHA56_13950 [Mucilaginibacter sp.]|nr:hypothetical protein [Mucilaginibacter sp.]
MKTENNRYQNQTLEASQTSACSEINETAKINAEQLASKNLPEATGDHMHPYVEEFHLGHQAEINKIDAELQMQLALAEVSEKQASTEQQARELQNKLGEAREQSVLIDSKRKNTSYPAYLMRLLMARFGILITCSFDGTLSIPVYETWGFSLIESIFMGTLFAGVLSLFAHTFKKLVQLGKTIWHRRLIALGLSALLIALFSYMAIARADYLSTMVNVNPADALNMHFSPLPFILTSLLLFIVAVAIHHFYMPTEEQKSAVREYIRLYRQKKVLEAEISQIEASITALHQENNELRMRNASILVYGAKLEERVINNAKICYALWKKHNLMHRSDTRRPDCFNEPYPFTFKTNFHLITSNNESNI